MELTWIWDSVSCWKRSKHDSVKYSSNSDAESRFLSSLEQCKVEETWSAKPNISLYAWYQSVNDWYGAPYIKKLRLQQHLIHFLSACPDKSLMKLDHTSHCCIWTTQVIAECFYLELLKCHSCKATWREMSGTVQYLLLTAKTKTFPIGQNPGFQPQVQDQQLILKTK
jgi:hypothetical protein